MLEGDQMSKIRISYVATIGNVCVRIDMRQILDEFVP